MTPPSTRRQGPRLSLCGDQVQRAAVVLAAENKDRVADDAQARRDTRGLGRWHLQPRDYKDDAVGDEGWIEPVRRVAD
jgi:hypothetical protein